MFLHRYLIGYVSESKHGQHILNAIIERSKPISTSKDVEKIQSELQKDCNAEKIILLSFSKLEGFNDVFT